MKHDIAGFHAKHFVHATNLWHLHLSTLKDALCPGKRLIARHVGPTRSFVKVLLGMSGCAQAVVLGAEGDEFPTAGFFVSFPLELGQTRCLGGKSSFAFKKERFGSSVAFLSRRSHGLVQLVCQ